MSLDFSNYLRDESRAAAGEPSDKLQRAAYSLCSGTAAGFSEEVNKALADPREALLKFGLSAVAGVGLSALQSKAGLGRLAGQAAAFSMGCAFLTDIAIRTDTAAGSFADAYNGKEADFRPVGRFAFDASLMTAGAFTGVLGHQAVTGRISLDFLKSRSAEPELSAQPQYHLSTNEPPLLNYQFDQANIQAIFGANSKPIPSMKVVDGKLVQEVKVVDQADPMAKLYKDIEPSILKIRWREGSASGTGTAVVLEDGWLATAHHCVKPSANGQVVNYYALIGETEHPIYPVWKDVSADLALMRMRDPAVVLPRGLQLGWAADLKAAQNVNAFGFPADANKVVLTQGPLVDVYAKIDCPSTDALTEPVHLSTARIRSRASTWTGNSGGPLVTDDGKVVGIVTSGIPTAAESFSSAIEHLHLILNRARNASFGSGPVNEVHTLGRVIGNPGDIQFKVKVDSLVPNWLKTSMAESVSKPAP